MSTCPTNDGGLFLSDLIKSTEASVDHIGVVPWALLVWVVWLILHSIYRKCFEGLLVRIGVQEPHRQRLIKVYWKISFASISLPFAWQNLALYSRNFSTDFIKVLNDLPDSLLFNEQPTLYTKLAYILLAGFYLNTVCEVCIEHGLKSWEFVRHESFTIFFVSTFPLRSVYFAISVITTLNIEKCLYESSRMLCCISSITNSRLLSKLSSGLLVVHSFIWCCIYFYVLPKYFLILPVYKMEVGGDASQMSLVSLLIVSIWSYYLLEIYSSPLSKLLLDHLYGNRRALEKILFGFNEFVEEDFIIENHMNHSIERTMSAASTQKKYRTEPTDRKKNRENLKLVYQTVKCVIKIRRKLKKIRDQKAKETFFDAPTLMEEEKTSG